MLFAERERNKANGSLSGQVSLAKLVLQRSRFDRKRVFGPKCLRHGYSSASVLMKRGTFIVVMAVAPILLAGLIARAAGDWQPIGSTASGDEILVSSIGAQKSSVRTAWIRVEYKEPTRLPQGGPFVELRARVRFNCASGSATPNSEWLYSRDRSGKLVVSKKARHDDQFGQSAEGGFGILARDYVCRQK
jgi:hypothetical protein